MRAPDPIWTCKDCGWRWPLKDAPSQDAECDACGGEMYPVQPTSLEEIGWENLGSGGSDEPG